MLLGAKASLSAATLVKRPHRFLYLWLIKIVKHEQYCHSVFIHLWFLWHTWNLFWETEWKTKIWHFPFLPPMNSMTKHSLDLTLHLPHTLCFCRRGWQAQRKPAFPGRRRSAQRDRNLPVLPVSLQRGHLNKHQPNLDGDNFSLALRAQNRIITWSAGLGPFVRNKKRQRS